VTGPRAGFHASSARAGRSRQRQSKWAGSTRQVHQRTALATASFFFVTASARRSFRPARFGLGHSGKVLPGGFPERGPPSQVEPDPPLGSLPAIVRPRRCLSGGLDRQSAKISMKSMVYGGRGPVSPIEK
jgi:hypothetical protein